MSHQISAWYRYCTCTHTMYHLHVHCTCICVSTYMYMCTHHLITCISFRVTSSSIKKTSRPDYTCEYCTCNYCMLLLRLQNLNRLFYVYLRCTVRVSSFPFFRIFLTIRWSTLCSSEYCYNILLVVSLISGPCVI